MGKTTLSIATLSLLLFLASTGNALNVFDVTTYGAHANADITQALLNAWKAACAAAGSSRVLVPEGTYRLGEVSLRGPCKGPIELLVQGTLQAPGDPAYFRGSSGWINFQNINQFTLSGAGTFDGQGQIAWKQNDCGVNTNCKTLAINLRFDFITNSIVRDIRSMNSKIFHINVFGCKNLMFQHIIVSAPGNSVNTDGIHIGRSSGINITDSNIGTGDDCISLGDGSQDVTIRNVSCGPGHGISIGSLGRYMNEQPVSGIRVIGCTLTNTTNGVRIKTWPASPSPGYATNMHFEDIIMYNVANPIIIDQQYCPWNQCKKQVPSKIKLSNISFKNIRGTSATKKAVELICSRNIPCEGVVLADIDLTYEGLGEPATSTCANVNPIISGKQNPPACTVKA